MKKNKNILINCWQIIVFYFIITTVYHYFKFSMLIDSHTHIFPFGLVNQDLTDWFKKTYNLENFKFGIKELINEMDVNSVEKSIVLPLIKENEFEMINNYMGKIQKKWTDRILCFGTINPKDTKSSLIELKKIKRNLNLKGIKLHPTIQQFYPNEEKFFKIYELAEKLDLPILFQNKIGKSNFSANS